MAEVQEMVELVEIMRVLLQGVMLLRIVDRVEAVEDLIHFSESEAPAEPEFSFSQCLLDPQLLFL